MQRLRFTTRQELLQHIVETGIDALVNGKFQDMAGEIVNLSVLFALDELERGVKPGVKVNMKNWTEMVNYVRNTLLINIIDGESFVETLKEVSLTVVENAIALEFNRQEFLEQP